LLIDARDVPDGTRLAFDICVIGAGVAGIAFAREWLGTDTRVGLIETGGAGLTRAAQALADAESVGRSYYPVGQTRARRLGGTSAWWSGECRPLDADADLAPRPWLDHPGWPVSAEELAPCYRRAQTVCGLSSRPFDPPEPWFSLVGLAPLALPPDDFATRFFLYSARLDLWRAYARDLEAAQNVQIVCHATVTALATDDAGGRVTAVEILVRPEHRLKVTAGHFVLAAGGIENARLLLVSRTRRTAGLGNAHGQVGRCFMEHLFFDRVARFEPAALHPQIGFHVKRRRIGGALVKATLAPTAGLLRREGLANFCLKFDAPSAADRGLIAAGAVHKWLRCGFHPALARRALPDLLTRAPAALVTLARRAVGCEFGTAAHPRPLWVSVTAEQLPNPDSRVALSTRRDPLGQPLARLDWRLGELDERAWLRGLELLGLALATSRLGRLVLPDQAAQVAALARARGGRHHMGTTRMATDPREGVVDAHARVHGIANLHVAGSSVFPTSGHANPTLTIVALALRLADRLKSAHS
jgi:choline dehydrogenase-like flavoprotein